MARRAISVDEEEEYDLTDAERPSWRERLRDWMFHHPRDAVAVFVAAAAALTIAINALFLQTGPHPAPLFVLRQVVPESDAGALPRARTAAEESVRIGYRAPRTRAELVADIQRGLATRGYYDGAVDGIYGPKTDAAVRDFAQGARIKVGHEPTEELLQSIVRSAVKQSQAASAAAMSQARRDPIADLIGPSSRVLAVQRALTDFGYGQLKPTGIPGPETAEAIEKFERSRRLPVTGQVTDRLIRELAAVTGRPLE